MRFSRRLLPLAALVSFAAAVPAIACSGGAGTSEEDLDSGVVVDTGGGEDTGAGDTSLDTGSTDTGATDTGTADTYVPPDGACTGPVDVPGCGLDTDCDGITDTLEGRYDPAGARDTDKDGTPDYKDDDSDGDGIDDRLEWRAGGCATGPFDDANDIDGDGIPNFQDLDSDGNGLPDLDEACPPAAVLAKLGMPACGSEPYDFDGDGTPDYLDLDNDHDSSKADKAIGLADKTELANNVGAYVGLTLDTDGDGIPDVYDVDSDGDFILDLDDGTTDDDGDKVPAFRDSDSDGDTVPDSCEARGKAAPAAGDLALPLVDTDSDGIPDFRDIDSDGDLLTDGKEDKDGDCKVDTTETSRLVKDTDGDGHDDLVETLLTPTGSSSWALDGTKTPWNQGKFYFLEPYSADGSAKPSPVSTPLALSTTLNSGDVAFMLDTTTSMNDIEASLASSIATIIPKLTAKIPDLQLGVVGYDDVLAKPFGDTTSLAGVKDSFIWFPNAGDPTKGSYLTSNVTDAINAAKGLNKVSPGGTFPEGSVPALWWAITGDEMSFYSTTTGLTKGFPAATGVPVDRFGGLRFRKNALPIVIQASDANMHNGLSNNCLDGTGVLASPCGPIAYPDAAAKSVALGRAPTIQDLRDELISIGGRYIGISVHGTGGTGTGRSSLVNRTTDPAYYQASLDMLYLANGTGAKVPPSVLGGTSTDCKTSNPTATLKNAPVSGLCPLVFDLSYDGVGLSDAVVNAVVALVTSIKFDVHVKATPVLSGTVDPVDAFLTNVLPMPAGGTDPVTGGICVTFPTTSTADRFKGPKALAGTDSAKETILDLNPGPLHCFAVTPKPNTTVKPTTVAQTFKANLQSYAQKPDGSSSALGTSREVLFIVPPVLN